MAKQASQEKHQKHDRQVDAEKQPILSHLMALRSVLIVSLGAVAVGFLIAYYAFLTPLMNFITKPITDRGIVIIYTAVSEAYHAAEGIPDGRRGAGVAGDFLQAVELFQARAL